MVVLMDYACPGCNDNPELKESYEVCNGKNLRLLTGTKFDDWDE